jgi:hypothetical protein
VKVDAGETLGSHLVETLVTGVLLLSSPLYAPILLFRSALFAAADTACSGGTAPRTNGSSVGVVFGPLRPCVSGCEYAVDQEMEVDHPGVRLPARYRALNRAVVR